MGLYGYNGLSVIFKGDSKFEAETICKTGLLFFIVILVEYTTDTVYYIIQHNITSSCFERPFQQIIPTSL